MTDQLPGMPHGMTHEETEYVYNVEVLGLPVRKAATMAGLQYHLINSPHVMAARASVRTAFARTQHVTKESVTQGLLDAIDRARLFGDPMTEIAGYDRLIKLHGLDVQKPDPSVNITINVFKEQISKMSDRELIESVGAGSLIDGDFYVVQDKQKDPATSD